MVTMTAAFESSGSTNGLPDGFWKSSLPNRRQGIDSAPWSKARAAFEKYLTEGFSAHRSAHNAGNPDRG